VATVLGSSEYSTGEPTPDMALSDDQVQSLLRTGFLTLPSITSRNEAAQIDATIKDLLNRKVGFKEGTLHDIVDPDDNLQSDQLTELVWTHQYAPQLHKTEYFRNALAIARQVLGPDANFAFDHAIFKPSSHGAETPWHQDEAYWSDANRGREQIAIWMPTTEATVENGCMRYIPLADAQRVLPHQPFNNDPRVHGLQCVGDFDAGEAVYCPLPPGGAVIHTARTLHSAGPNITPNPRLAYILVFSTPPRVDVAPVPFDWLVGRNETTERRRQQWLRRGGVVIELLRSVQRRSRHGSGKVVQRLARALRLRS
jgi:ectoine hydroxylase-related dioxygenase (phytanoyl-CoA dioxygenase family)